MKTKSFITAAVVAGLSLLFVAFEYSLAAKEKTVSLKIGIVSVKEVFDNYAAKTDVEKTLTDEGEKRFAELKKLEDSIDTDKAALSKRKENSQDYMELLQSLMMKQAQLQAQKEFYQQQLTMKEIQEKEKIYRKILAAVADVAKEKGLDIILNKDDNYLNGPDSSATAQSQEDFIITTKTHKLLYFDPGLDITASVVSAMNKKTD